MSASTGRTLSTAMRPLAVALRVDAGPGIGFGHLMRSAALGAALRDGHGAQAHLFLAGDAHAQEIAGATGIAWSLAADAGHDGHDGHNRLRSWAHVHAGARRVLVVDRPHLAEGFIATARAAAGACAVACFMDGTAWPGPVDVAINGGAYWRHVDWTPLAPDARRCFGPAHLCIRPLLVAQRPVSRRLGAHVERVLITLGGSDPQAATPAVLAAIGRVAAALRAAGDVVPRPEVVIGPGFRHEAAIVAALRGLDTAAGGPGAVVHRGAGDLGPLMTRAGLAVAAGGSTLYELALFGIPAIALPQTPDEALNAAAVAAAGACAALPRNRQEWEALLPDTLLRLLRDTGARRAMSTAGQALVDGGGAARVASAIVDATSTKTLAAPPSWPPA